MLPLFDEPELLKELKEVHLTFDKNDDVPIATGVPVSPHISHSKAIKEVLSISDAVDKKVAAEGGVNSAILDRKLQDLQRTLAAKIDTAVDTAVKASQNSGTSSENAVVVSSDNVHEPTPYQFHYSDEKGHMKYWCVPESFQFPRDATRLNGWRKWLLGSVHIDGGTAWKVKPYRNLSKGDLKCQSQKNDLKAWRGVFKLMEKAVTLPEKDEDINAAFVVSSYQVATDYLKDNYSFLYIKHTEEHLALWRIGTWFKKTRRGYVEHNGMEQDVAKLPAKSKLNKPHASKRSFKVHNRRRPNKVAKRGRSQRSSAGIPGDD